VGFPPLNGFWSKFMIILGMVKGNALIPVYIILFASVVEAVYYLRLIYFIYSGKQESKISLSFAVGFPAVVFLIFVLLLGFYPVIMKGTLSGGLNDMINRSWYIINVFGG